MPIQLHFQYDTWCLETFSPCRRPEHQYQNSNTCSSETRNTCRCVYQVTSHILLRIGKLEIL